MQRRFEFEVAGLAPSPFQAARVVARSDAGDGILVQVADGRFAVFHLTWGEAGPAWQAAALHQRLEDIVHASIEGRPASVEDRLIVALDTPTVTAARGLAAGLGEAVRFYKVGMALFFDREFSALVDELTAAGKQVFLDYKMYDIPETVRRGVAAVAARGARIVTVHGDPEIVAAAVDGARGTGLLVFAVTVLTSQDDAALAAMGYRMTVPELVALRVGIAARAGAHGVIASAADDPAELKRMAGRPLLVATPGIRLPGGAAHDQKRVATPDAAVRRGADYLIVGRPITQAEDPGAAAQEVLRLMAAGSQG